MCVGEGGEELPLKIVIFCAQHDLLKIFQNFRSSLIEMFWTFKLSFDVDILAFLPWQLF